jgi:hypothetical protein
MPKDKKICGNCNVKAECLVFTGRERNISRSVADRSDPCALFPSMQRVKQLVADLALGTGVGGLTSLTPAEMAPVIEAALSGKEEHATCGLCPANDDCEHYKTLCGQFDTITVDEAQACAAFPFIERFYEAKAQCEALVGCYKAVGAQGDWDGAESVEAYVEKSQEFLHDALAFAQMFYNTGVGNIACAVHGEELQRKMAVEYPGAWMATLFEEVGKFDAVVEE